MQGAIRTARSELHKKTIALDDKIAIPNGTPKGPLRLHWRFETTARIWHPISDPANGTLNIFTHDWNPNQKQIGECANLWAPPSTQNCCLPCQTFGFQCFGRTSSICFKLLPSVPRPLNICLRNSSIERGNRPRRSRHRHCKLKAQAAASLRALQ